jgi:hypothetical protein
MLKTKAQADPKLVLEHKLNTIRQRIKDDASNRLAIAIADLTQNLSRDVVRWANKDFMAKAHAILKESKLDPTSAAECQVLIAELALTPDDVKR